MADYVIFKIGSVDYTDKIKLSEYKAERADVTEQWIDGNYITRSSVIRTRVSGAVKMVLRAAEYNTFLNDLETAKIQPGVYSLSVHVDNETTATENVTISAFVTVEAKTVFMPQVYQFQPTALEVDIEFEEI